MLTEIAKKRIRGVLPIKRDIVDWSSDKIMAFLKFIDFFTDNGKFACNLPNVEAAKRRAQDEPFWDEFILRIDGDTTGKFAKRFISFARVPLAWIKNNPHAISQEMLEIMQKNPRMSWASRNFKLVETQMGITVVERDNLETTDPGRYNANPTGTDVKTPAYKFEQAKLNFLTLMLELSNSIPRDELKKMVVKDRIQLFDKMINTATRVMSASRPNALVFQNININKASREELEKSMLAAVENQVYEP